MVKPDEPSTFLSILRELPRRKVVLVLLVVGLNLGVVAYLKGRAIARTRHIVFSLGEEIDDWSDGGPVSDFVPPWRWTADEWRETAFQWK